MQKPSFERQLPPTPTRPHPHTWAETGLRAAEGLRATRGALTGRTRATPCVVERVTMFEHLHP
jgi:hypothetical protein